MVSRKIKQLIITFVIGQFIMVSVSVAGKASDVDFFELSLQELMSVEVTTASKYSERSIDTPANIIVFSSEQIKQRGFRNVADILYAMPGVDLQNFSSFGLYSIVTIRGNPGNNKFLVLQDGVRISSAGGEETKVSYNFPVYYAKQVEVLMGSAAVAYGADAFMGVINIITLDKSTEDIAQVTVTAGTEDYISANVIVHQSSTDSVSYSVGVHSYLSQEYDFADQFPEYYPSNNLSPTGESFEFPQLKAHSFFLKLKGNKHWGFGINHSSIEAATYFSSRSDISAFDKDAIQKDLLTTVYTKFDLDVSDEIHSTSLLSYMRYETDNDTNFNNLFTGFEAQYKYAETDRYSFNQDFTWHINKRHLFSSGFVYDYFSTVPTGADLPSKYDESKEADEQNFLYPGTTLPMLLFDYNHENVGFYIQDNWNVNSKWRLVTGLRVDDDSQYGSSTNPRVSVIYQYNTKNVLKILYGHSFLAPSPDFIYRNFGGFSGFNADTGLWESNFFWAPNLELKPEKLRSFEVNFEHWFDRNSYIKLAPYIIKIDDAIVGSADAEPKQFIPGAQINFTESYKNSSSLDVYGVDISLDNNFTLGVLDIDSWIAVSYTDGDVDDDVVSSELQLTAKYKLKAGMSIRYQQKYTLTPKLYWIGTTTGIELDANNNKLRNHNPSYFLMDLHARAQLTKKLVATINVYNVMDKKYTNAVNQTSSIALDSSPQPSRLITMGFKYKF